MTESNLKAGFRSAGLWPVNEAVIPPSLFEASTIYTPGWEHVLFCWTLIQIDTSTIRNSFFHFYMGHGS